MQEPALAHVHLGCPYESLACVAARGGQAAHEHEIAGAPFIGHSQAGQPSARKNIQFIHQINEIV